MNARPRKEVHFDKVVSVRFTEKQWQTIKAEAKKEGLKGAAWIRKQSLSVLK